MVLAPIEGFLLVTIQKGFWSLYREVSRLVQALGSGTPKGRNLATCQVLSTNLAQRSGLSASSRNFLPTAAHHPLCFAPTLNMVYALLASQSLSTPNEDKTGHNLARLVCLESSHVCTVLTLYTGRMCVYAGAGAKVWNEPICTQKEKRFPRSPVASRIRWGKMAGACQEAKVAGEEREGEEYFQQHLSTTLFQSQDAPNTIAFSRSFPIWAGDA